MLSKRFYLHRLTALLALTVLLVAGCQTTPAPGLTAAQIAVLKQQGFTLNDDGWELGLSSKLLFGNDEDTVDETSKPAVTRIARALLDVNLDRLRLEGHTDAYGDPDYNRRLSVRRAQSVAQILIDAGFPADNIQVLGLGMDKPVADNMTASGRLENRRVAIIIPVQ